MAYAGLPAPDVTGEAEFFLAPPAGLAAFLATVDEGHAVRNDEFIARAAQPLLVRSKIRIVLSGVPVNLRIALEGSRNPQCL